jgi:hypothetical protein
MDHEVLQEYWHPAFLRVVNLKKELHILSGEEAIFGIFLGIMTFLGLFKFHFFK